MPTAKASLPIQVLKAFETVPDLYVILSPDLIILTASDAYLQATHTNRTSITGKSIFDLFPDDATSPRSYFITHLHHSFQQVITTGKPHQMTVHRYDVPLSQDGGLEEKYWIALNTPVLNEHSQVYYLIHKIEDVTPWMKGQPIN